ncbi:MAG: hypothetical protein AAF799_22175 [Myxococcota bacterium]
MLTFVGLMGCGPSPRATPASTAPATSAPDQPPSPPLTCVEKLGIEIPPDVETMEDPTTWVSLRELYPARPPADLRVTASPPPKGTINLGEHEVFLPSWADQWGLSWSWEGPDLDPAMVEPGLEPEAHAALVEFLESLDRFEDATAKRTRAVQELYYLIAVANETDEFFERASDCFDSVERHHDDAVEEAELRMMDARDRVSSRLAEAKQRNGTLTPEERYLQAEMRVYDEESDIDELVERFKEIADDPRTPPLIRAHALELVIVYTGDEQLLRQTLTMDLEPEFEQRLMVLLVDTYDEEDEHEVALLDEVIAYLETQPYSPELARQRGRRARYRLVAGDVVGARDDAIACLREPAVDPFDDEYTEAWACTESLASALTTLGTEAPDTTIPPSVVGLMAPRLMVHAALHHDIATARHVGHVALRVAPESPNIPLVLDHLTELEPDPHTRERLQRDRERVIASGPWRDAQLGRLAFDEEEEDVLHELDHLTEERPEPREAEEITQGPDWKLHLENIVGACRLQLQPGERYRIDVQGHADAPPKISVRGPKARACIEAELPGYLRDFGTARLRAVLKIEDD